MGYGCLISIDKLCRAASSGVAGAARRVRLPALQPAAGAHRGAQRRAAAAADEARQGGPHEARLGRALGRRPRRPDAPLSAPALGRPGAARRHRARHRHRSDAAAVRRADGRSRSEGRRRDPGAAPGPQQRAQQDDCHGDARPACRGPRQADAAPREGRPRDGGGRMKYLHIVWKNLLRRKIRTIFTLLSIFVAFVLFGYLMAVRSAFNMGVDLAGADRLMVLNKISIIMPVPRQLRRKGAGDRRGQGRHARQLVRRLLPGDEEPVPEHGGRPRELAPHVPGVPGARRTRRRRGWPIARGRWSAPTR